MLIQSDGNNGNKLKQLNLFFLNEPHCELHIWTRKEGELGVTV